MGCISPAFPGYGTGPDPTPGEMGLWALTSEHSVSLGALLSSVSARCSPSGRPEAIGM